MKTACRVQCPQCPFRKTSMRGWLGAYDAGSVFSSIWRNMPFFCHPKIDYEDPEWEAQAMKDGKLCLGGLVFAKRIMSPMRADAYPETDPEVLTARVLHQDRTDVECMTAREFGAHHATVGPTP